jgi:transposase
VCLSGLMCRSARRQCVSSTRDGVVLWQGKVASEPGPLVARLAEWSGVIDLAGIEACPLSEWLHRGLREAGIPVVCIEVRHARRLLSSRPVKTDRNDARGIAEMMRLGHYRPVHVKSPAAQSIRACARLMPDKAIAGMLNRTGRLNGWTQSRVRGFRNMRIPMMPAGHSD